QRLELRSAELLPVLPRADLAPLLRRTQVRVLNALPQIAPEHLCEALAVVLAGKDRRVELRELLGQRRLGGVCSLGVRTGIQREPEEETDVHEDFAEW